MTAIEQLRRDRSLSPKQCAAKAEPPMTRQQWEQIEREGIVKFDMAQRIAKVLDYGRDWYGMMRYIEGWDACAKDQVSSEVEI